jgi:hypothetical protein
MTPDRAYSADESVHLPVHVARCEERYRTLFRRLERIERIMLVVAAKVFVLLLAVIGFLAARVFPG